ncbi:MAG: 3'-5' exonuclease [Oscillospiraceae bacterium]|jgi:DNA polymerase III epsilon subunit family exonuclease|nr:3'-5' exonuclease [Oscillospiraceae bacterium]
MGVVVLDFETTGLSPESGEVVEFALVRVRGGELGLEMASLCRPHGEIPYDAFRVHGISKQMTLPFPYFEELLPSVLGFIGGDTVVCHNTPFDMGFLRAYCARAGVAFDPPLGDTLNMARRLFRQLPSRSLGAVAQHLGVDAPGAHRALYDATVTAKIYIKMANMLNDMGFAYPM